MPAKQKNSAAEISDAAVVKATGKTWNEWYSLLDKAGAKKLDHGGIVAVLDGKHAVRPWWQQMVAVAYERARGLRAKYQTPSGWNASASRTLPVPLARLYRAWAEEEQRARWLGEEGIEIRKATRNRSLRITWSDRATSVEVMFLDKGGSKSVAHVQHSKLAHAQAVARAKRYWAAALDRLTAHLGVANGVHQGGGSTTRRAAGRKPASRARAAPVTRAQASARAGARRA